MTEPRAILFASQDTASHDIGVTDREVVIDGTRWATVEYEGGCHRAGWCSTPHSGYVISGALSYEFDDARSLLALREGDGFLLPATPRHRGRNDGSTAARIFLIDALPAGPD